MSRNLTLGLGFSYGGFGQSRPPGGALLWARADFVGPGAVSSWPDRSGSGNSPVQPSAPNQPINTANAGPAVGLPALVFTSASQQNLALANALIGTKNYTIAVVGKVSATSASQVFCNAGDTTSGLSVAVDLNAGSQRDFNANAVVAVSDSTNLATTSWEAWIFSSDASGNLALLVNGAAHTLSSASATLLAPTAHFTIGAQQNGTSPLNGSIFEIIVYGSQSAALTAALKAYQSQVTKLF